MMARIEKPLYRSLNALSRSRFARSGMPPVPSIAAAVVTVVAAQHQPSIQLAHHHARTGVGIRGRSARQAGMTRAVRT